MPYSKKVLEDSIRLGRIRAIKKTLYVVQVALLVALAFFFVFVIGDAALKPRLYLPIDDFIAVLVLVMLIICVESFFFRMLEIRFARSSSARHLMAKNSIMHSLLIVIVAGIVTVILMVPSVLAVTEDATRKTITTSSAEDLTFWSMDPLALQRVSELQVTCPDIVEVYVVRDSDYLEYGGAVGDMYFMRINRLNYEVDGSLTIVMPEMDYVMLHVVVNDIESPGSTVTVEIVNDTSETITEFVAILSMAFVVANVAWMAYLTPIEKKYAQGSIYK